MERLDSRDDRNEMIYKFLFFILKKNFFFPNFRISPGFYSQNEMIYKFLEIKFFFNPHLII